METFKKGDYIVLLTSCNGENCWLHQMPINYCYILNEDYTIYNFNVIKDIEDRNNGWYSNPDIYMSQLKIRKASLEESMEYDRLKKPFDVTTLVTETKPEDLSYLIKLFKELNIE